VLGDAAWQPAGGKIGERWSLTAEMIRDFGIGRTRSGPQGRSVSLAWVKAEQRAGDCVTGVRRGLAVSE